MRLSQVLIVSAAIVLAYDFTAFVGELSHGDTVLIETFDRTEAKLARNGLGVPFTKLPQMHINLPIISGTSNS